MVLNSFYLILCGVSRIQYRHTIAQSQYTEESPMQTWRERDTHVRHSILEVNSAGRCDRMRQYRQHHYLQSRENYMIQSRVNWLECKSRLAEAWNCCVMW